MFSFLYDTLQQTHTPRNANQPLCVPQRHTALCLSAQVDNETNRQAMSAVAQLQERNFALPP